MAHYLSNSSAMIVTFTAKSLKARGPTWGTWANECFEVQLARSRIRQTILHLFTYCNCEVQNSHFGTVDSESKFPASLTILVTSFTQLSFQPTWGNSFGPFGQLISLQPESWQHPRQRSEWASRWWISKLKCSRVVPIAIRLLAFGPSPDVSCWLFFTGEKILVPRT